MLTRQTIVAALAAADLAAGTVGAVAGTQDVLPPLNLPEPGGAGPAAGTGLAVCHLPDWSSRYPAAATAGIKTDSCLGRKPDKPCTGAPLGRDQALHRARLLEVPSHGCRRSLGRR